MSEGPPSPPRRVPLLALSLGVLLVTLTVVLLLPMVTGQEEEPATAEIELPPTDGGIDYQLGGAYPVPEGVTTVVRDRLSAPAEGVYNVCYVNAFQSQPGDTRDWPDDLLLRDSDGELVIDRDWDEALLDISTPDRRERAAARVNRWIDGCAEAGYDAVEPDNYDSYTRSQGLLTAGDALAYLRLLAEHAHQRGLAVAQKNTVELTDRHARVGLDFAVAEECGAYQECGTYAAAYGDRVLVVEYTDAGLRRACAEWGDRLRVVRRDPELVTPEEDGYVRETCPTR